MAGVEHETLAQLFDDEMGGGLSELHAQARVRAALLGEVAPAPALERYVLAERIGSGAMGEVWRAHDPQLGRDIAIKLVRAPLESRASRNIARLAREARALARLSDPHVVQVFDVGSYAIDGERRGVFVVMELVRGCSLDRWLEAETRGRDELLAVFLQAGRGLAAAHAVGLVHRDFKPGNVLIASAPTGTRGIGRVCVGDFGLARALTEHDVARPESGDGGEHEVGETLEGLTETGATVGTPLYMAPEQHRGETVDARADQFAFCVAAYQAFAGVRPFAGNYDAVLRAKAEHTITPPPRSAALPDALVAVLRRGLSPEPDARWPSMDALLAAMTRACRPRRRAWFVAAGVAMVALFAWRTSTASPGCEPRSILQRGLDDGGRALLDQLAGANDEAGLRALLEARVRTLAHAADVACDAADTVAQQRVTCLRDVAVQLVTTMDALADARALDESSMAAVSGLPSVEGCAALDDVREAERVPEQLRERVAMLRDELARAQALLRFGDIDRARDVAQAVRERAEQTELEPWLGASARFVVALADVDAGREPDGERGMNEAYVAAVHHHDDETAFKAAGEIAMIVAERGDASEADVWLHHAASWFHGYGDDARIGRWELTQGVVRGLAGELDRAAQHFGSAIERCGHDVCSVTRLSATRNLAMLVERRGDDDRALALRREAAALALRIHGEASRAVVEARLEIVQSAISRGQPQEALDELHAILPALEQHDAGGMLAAIAASLEATARSELDQPVEQLAFALRAWSIVDRTLPIDHPRRISYLGTLANARAANGDLPRALADFERALALAEPDGYDAAWTLIARSEALLAFGRPEAALADAIRGRRILLATAADAEEMIANAWRIHATALLELGRCDEARVSLRDADAWAQRCRARDRCTTELRPVESQLRRECGAASR